jgi:hypothetical protein
LALRPSALGGLPALRPSGRPALGPPAVGPRSAGSSDRPSSPELGPSGGPYSPDEPSSPELSPSGGPYSPDEPSSPELGPSGGPYSPDEPSSPVLGPSGGPYSPDEPTFTGRAPRAGDSARGWAGSLPLAAIRTSSDARRAATATATARRRPRPRPTSPATPAASRRRSSSRHPPDALRAPVMSLADGRARFRSPPSVPAPMHGARPRPRPRPRPHGPGPLRTRGSGERRARDAVVGDTRAEQMSGERSESPRSASATMRRSRAHPRVDSRAR